jgi:hypothetical protein
LWEAAEGTEGVAIGTEEKWMDEAFITEVNRAFAAQGRPGQLALLPQRAPIQGGFVLHGRGVETNCSFEMLIRQRRSELEKQAAQLLFEA